MAEAEAEVVALKPAAQLEMEKGAEAARMTAVDANIDATIDKVEEQRIECSDLKLIPTTTERQLKKAVEAFEQHRKVLFAMLPLKDKASDDMVVVL
eukprot:7341114-Prymnesium_polylepis.1